MAFGVWGRGEMGSGRGGLQFINISLAAKIALRLTCAGELTLKSFFPVLLSVSTAFQYSERTKLSHNTERFGI